MNEFNSRKEKTLKAFSVILSISLYSTKQHNTKLTSNIYLMLAKEKKLKKKQKKKAKWHIFLIKPVGRRKKKKKSYRYQPVISHDQDGVHVFPSMSDSSPVQGTLYNTEC